MTVYYRQRRSTYANYRYRNPNQASFIAPEGKVANFNWWQGAQDLLGGANNDFIQGAAARAHQLGRLLPEGAQNWLGLANDMTGKTGVQQLGVAGQAVADAFVPAKGVLGQVADTAQGAMGYAQSNPGRAGVLAGEAAAGAGILAGARGLLGRLMQRKAAVQQGAEVAGQVAQAAPRLSTAQKAAIGVGGAGALGGAAYLATRPGEQRQY